jgi:alpha-beta hydrolase superfamily lysophospholipase
VLILRNTFIFKNKDGIDINAYKWIPKGNIRGIIQIAHGMSEKAIRYEYLAEKLTEVGFLVYANDHRGHGKSAKSIDELGYISHNDGFKDMVEDMKQLLDIINMENPQGKIILLGHSMGSFLAQRYIQLYGMDLAGVILSGTNGKQKPIINLGILVSKTIMNFKGRKYKSSMINNLAFGSYNKKINPVHTPFDWLTRDEDEVDKYITDPYCGTLFPVSFFYDLFKGMKLIHKEENLRLVPKDLPIYILGGNADPVGNYGEGIINLYKTYKSQNIKFLSYKIYTGGRHEMFNEINKDEVIKDTIEWIMEIL